ncbi:MAG: hypothetical protein A9183_07310 [Dehalococcoides mccartyi]|uniref:hypothetical protein n=1 Tax=Dehalococcoides mccartyi TaxID=61435 RepID=UPI0008050DBD|nr:hypothetical protein [Dehalococcoides mccartyi]OBW62526.1 MAG: hypothetical protein A9183_07310 [Dehalococcoides mccartyi]
MKNKIVLRLLGILTFFTLSLVGCDSDEALWGTTPVPSEITYQGQLYRNTGKLVAKQQVLTNIHPLGTYDAATSTVAEYTTGSLLSPDDYGRLNPTIYSIDGVKTEESIAVKVLLVTHSGTAWYYYFKYERVS